MNVMLLCQGTLPVHSIQLCSSSNVINAEQNFPPSFQISGTDELEVHSVLFLDARILPPTFLARKKKPIRQVTSHSK